MESPKKAPDQRGLYLATFRDIYRGIEFFPSLQFLSVFPPPYFSTGVSCLTINRADQVICVWEITEAKGEFEGVFSELAHWSSIQNWYMTLPYLCNSDAHVQTNFKFLAELFRRFAGKQWAVFIREDDWPALKNGLQQLKTESGIDFQVKVPSNVPGQSKKMRLFAVPKKIANPEIPKQPEVALNPEPVQPALNEVEPVMKKDQTDLYLMVCRCIDGTDYFFPNLGFLNFTWTPIIKRKKAKYIRRCDSGQTVYVWMEVTRTEVRDEFERVFSRLRQWSTIQNWYVSLPYPCTSEAYIQTNLWFVRELFSRFVGKEWTVFIQHEDWAFLKNDLSQLSIALQTNFQVRIPTNVTGESALLWHSAASRNMPSLLIK